MRPHYAFMKLGPRVLRDRRENRMLDPIGGRWRPAMRGALLAGFALAAVTTTSDAQRFISGSVVDTDGDPVAYAVIESVTRRVVADDSGHFRVLTGAGAGFLRIRRIGFKPLNAKYEAGADTSLTLQLEPVARMLETAVIEATAVSRTLVLRGFYRRYQDHERGINAGQFITAEEIQQRSPNRITQMLEGRTGVKAARVGGGGYNRFAQNCLAASAMCFAPQGVGGCWMTVYLDGRRLNSIRGGSNSPGMVDEIVIPTHVAGMEVYTSPLRAPPEYQSLNGTCGVVLIWTR